MDIAKGDQRTEEFRRLNPFETVPTIVHGDYNLWESAAIITYLADAFAIDSHWYPKDIKKRGRINAYFHWHHTNTRFYCRALGYYAIVSVVLYGLPPTAPDRLLQVENDLRDFLREFDEKLGNGYVCGAEISIADIFAFNEVMGLQIVEFDHSCYANISRWFKEIEEIPEIRETFEAVTALRIEAGLVKNKGA